MKKFILMLKYFKLDYECNKNCLKLFTKHPIYQFGLHYNCATDELRYQAMIEKYGSEMAYLRFQAYGLE